ncbi:MAG: HTTM domain-containing protein [Verrucomicrobia bacterium]|nr:HTTM domain-containing protein [Verrucomicrobiota bacterium]
MVVLLLYALWMLFTVAFTLGYRTSWATPMLLLFYGYFYLLNLAVKDTAYDRLNLILLTTACFGRLDSIWAARPTLSTTPDTDFPINNWVARMIRLQICFLYFGAGLWKFSAPAWQGHEMMRWTLLGAWGTPLAFRLAALNLPNIFYFGLGWSVIIFELIAPFTLNFRSTSKATMIAGTAFHVGVALLLNIPEFFNCIATYALFWPPEELAAFGHRLRVTVAPRRPTPE